MRKKLFVKEEVEIYTTFPLSYQKRFQTSAQNLKQEIGTWKKISFLSGSVCQKEN